MVYLEHSQEKGVQKEMTKKSILPDLSGIPDTLIKYADEYWQYWWVLLIGIVGFVGYIIFGKYFQ